jgi:hypothetical protein
VKRLLIAGSRTINPTEPEIDSAFSLLLYHLDGQQIVVVHGNANGVGLANIVTRRLYGEIDLQATYANVFTTGFLNRANIPVIMETDRDAIEKALSLLHLEDSRQARMVRIRNTLELGRIQISEPLWIEVEENEDISPLGEPKALEFDRDGNLV